MLKFHFFSKNKKKNRGHAKSEEETLGAQARRRKGRNTRVAEYRECMYVACEKNNIYQWK